MCQVRLKLVYKLDFFRSNNKCGCRRVFGSINEEVFGTTIPMEMAISVPVVAFEKSAWTKKLVDFVFELVCNQCNVSSISATISKSRVAKYLADSSHYISHVK